MPRFNIKFYKVADGTRDERIVTAKDPEAAQKELRKTIDDPIHILKTKLDRTVEPA